MRVRILIPLIVLLLIPSASWAFYKPVRVLVPELNGDPRPVLSEPWQERRSQFQAWFKAVGRERLWIEAERL